MNSPDNHASERALAFVTQAAKRRAHAELRARQWRTDGEAALKDGNAAWAEDCFEKARYWQGKASEIDGYGLALAPDR
ncbi:hypothetical protein [Pseudoduganella namucuonensis]|uniref:Uncharacterized protein n=1 Tax=Pseudoduganella namucuonensis TaxID=1035707 RepID=A0A1I7L815_9BURK|nr:hypothetical protein [Pseudoduganella namucuonensis]SFV05877.1 hypothetical protein SAMN05216552_1024101 [Pseudoduganella namucuonensis]